MSLNANWNVLIKPEKILAKAKGENPNIAEIVIQPLERGYGLTLGNSLRRILLSSLQGAAITAVKIPGVDHEYSVKQGVKEDILDMILNLKKIRIKQHTEGVKKIFLKAKGPCVVTAEMIQTVSDLEILNPEQEICTISKDTTLEMELQSETGKGYVSATADLNEKKELPVGFISIDALYNPVRKVAYKVENARVGQITDYDKLIMTIETDGSITPELAIGLAARVLQDQMQVFIKFEEEEVTEEAEEELQYNPVLLKRVDELELSVRSRNCLQNDNIVYIGDLVNKTEAQMLKTQNFGRKSLNEIKDLLAKFQLKFGMEIEGWPPDNMEELCKKYEEINN